jgi:hypothetical protein
LDCVFESKEMNNGSGVSSIALVKMLHRIVDTARKNGNELEILGGILAVAVKGYRKTMGEQQSAMLFYSIADDLATSEIHDEWDDSDGDESR